MKLSKIPFFRFFEPKSGNIKIGDHDIDSVDMDCLRKHIAIVPQDSVLFHNSIFHNINYGNLQASNDQVIQAAKMAELHDSILVRFENRYQLSTVWKFHDFFITRILREINF